MQGQKKRHDKITGQNDSHAKSNCTEAPSPRTWLKLTEAPGKTG